MKLAWFFLFVVAFLIGISAFGIYKSLELVMENRDLKLSFNELEVKFDGTRASLKEARNILGQSQQKSAALEKEVADLNVKLADRSDEIHGYLEQIAKLSENFDKSVKTNIALIDQNNRMTKDVMRLEFENMEMKNRVSSIQGLKAAIRTLRLQEKEARLKAAKAGGQQKPPQARTVQQVDKLSPQGNQGYILKDGRLTFEEQVDIRVIPVEPIAKPAEDLP